MAQIVGQFGLERHGLHTGEAVDHLYEAFAVLGGFERECLADGTAEVGCGELLVDVVQRRLGNVGQHFAEGHGAEERLAGLVAQGETQAFEKDLHLRHGECTSG